MVGGRVERSLTPIVDEVWRRRKRRRRVYCVIIHKGYGDRAEENDLHAHTKSKEMP